MRQASCLSSILFLLAIADSQRQWIIGQTKRNFFFLPVGISPSRLTLQDILINLHSTRTSYNQKWFSLALHLVNMSFLIERKAMHPPPPLQAQPVQKLLTALRAASQIFYLFNFFFSFFFFACRVRGSLCAQSIII